MMKQIITHIITLLVILLYASNVIRAAESAVDEDWPAIEHCLGIIRICQMDDGMIRMKSYGDPVWAVPYFGNLAAMALLAANDVRESRHDVTRVERWLMWYASHQEPDGTIYDREGTLSAYKSNGKQDASDSYAATFLMTTQRYKKAIGGRPSAEIINAAKKSLMAIDAAVQEDGLTIAKPDYPIKYLMDNIEVYQGLSEGALLFDSVGMKKESEKARQMSSRVDANLKKYWSDNDRYFAYALDMKDKFSTGFSQPYPHGLAQLFALSYMKPTRPKLWAKVKHTFKPGEKGIPIERWLIAARCNAEPKKVENFRRATRKTALHFSTKNVYIERPAMVVIALLDGKARLADVPYSPRRDNVSQ